MERFLQPLRDDPLPPSAVDLGRALADGRRRVRHRRLASIAAAGFAVFVLVGGVTVVLPPTGGEPDTDRGSVAQTPTASGLPMPARAPAAFDPARRYAAFGWLPDGLTDSLVKTGTDQLLVAASQPAADPYREPPGVELRLVTAGHDIAPVRATDPVEPGVSRKGAGMTVADPVNGRTAYWNDRAVSEGPGAALRWEYAPNAWAEVAVRGRVADADARVTARRIAETVRYSVDEPIRLPFRIAGLPDSLHPMSVMTVTSTTKGISSWEAQVWYGAGKRAASGDWPLLVMVLPRASLTGEPGIGDPNGKLDGHPARRSSMSDGGKALQVYGVQGLYLELATYDAATTRLLPNGLDGLFRSMTLYPDPADWR